MEYTSGSKRPIIKSIIDLFIQEVEGRGETMVGSCPV